MAVFCRYIFCVLITTSGMVGFTQANAQDFFSQLKSAVSSGIGIGGGFPKELENLFSNSPFDLNSPTSTQFPHVAFTVITSPNNHDATVMGSLSQPQYAGCWSLSAVVWRNATESENIAPFTACMPGAFQPASGVPLRSYMDWWSVQAPMRNAAIKPGDSTGGRRTSGPIPPDTVFPVSAAYRKYFKGFGAEGPSPMGLEAYFWGALLVHMGFEPSQLYDRRFWVVEYKEISG